MGIPSKILTTLPANSLAEAHLGLTRISSVIEPCTIYTLHEKLGALTSIANGFASSAQTAQRLRHVNLAQIHDVSTHAGRPMLICEYIEGIDLRSLHKRSADSGIEFSVPMAVYVACELAKTLAYLHGFGSAGKRQGPRLIVRCLLPSTVTIGIEGEVRLSGHGISGATEGSLAAFPDEAFADSRRYLAPELLAGLTPVPATDIYALGALFWEMLTSRRFSGDATCPPNVPADLQKLVYEMVSPQVENRPHDAQVIEKTLATFLHEHYPKFSPRHLGSYVANLFGKELKATGEEIKAGIGRSDFSTFAEVPTPPVPGALERPQTSQMQYQKGRDLDLDESANDGNPELALKGKPASLGDVRRELKSSLTAPHRSQMPSRLIHRRPAPKKGPPLWLLLMFATAAAVAGYFYLHQADSVGDPPAPRAAAKTMPRPAPARETEP